MAAFQGYCTLYSVYVVYVFKCKCLTIGSVSLFMPVPLLYCAYIPVLCLYSSVFCSCHYRPMLYCKPLSCSCTVYLFKSVPVLYWISMSYGCISVQVFTSAVLCNITLSYGCTSVLYTPVLCLFCVYACALLHCILLSYACISVQACTSAVHCTVYTPVLYLYLCTYIVT